MMPDTPKLLTIKKGLLEKILLQKHNRLKRPVVQYIINNCPEFKSIHGSSLQTARTLFNSHFGTEFYSVQYFCMTKPLPEATYNRFISEYTIDQTIIQSFATYLSI